MSPGIYRSVPNPLLRKAVYKKQRGVERAANTLRAAGYIIAGENVTIETSSGVRIVADLIVRDGNQWVIVEVKNGVHAGFTANQVLTGVADGATISGVVRGVKGGFLLSAGSLVKATSFVLRYL